MAKIKVSVERIDGHCNLPVRVGDNFTIDGSRLYVPEGSYVCIWALQSMMPVFPIFGAKEQLEEGHWVKTVKHFSCPDPKGLVQYRLELVKDGSQDDI
ncbi:MAG: TIGR04076 family protein, partial [Candidatus Aminicenantes bacterium]|nr:TIGR04076 family protein [Candidatus Aminicenantes bacterium]